MENLSEGYSVVDPNSAKGLFNMPLTATQIVKDLIFLTCNSTSDI